MIPVIVTTCRRPSGVNYLDQTLASIEDSGLSRPDRTCITLGDDEGAYGAFKLASTYLLKTFPHAHWLAILQDDILVSKRLGKFLRRQQWWTNPNGVGCVSLYTAGRMTDKYPHDTGWRAIDLEKPVERCNYGACGLLFPREMLWAFLRANVAPEEKNRTEAHVANWCLDNRLDYLMHFPESFVQHIGAVSAITNHHYDFGCTIPDRCATRFLKDCIRLERT